MDDKTVIVHIEKVPEELYRRFKALCVLEGKQIREKFVEMLERELERVQEGEQ